MDTRNVARALMNPIYKTIGGRAIYRISRFLLNESRRDGANAIQESGETMIQRAALKSTNAPVLVFDVGANVGDWTEALLDNARELGKEVSIHAFEPCNGTFKRLQSRAQISDWRNVIVVNKACSRTSGVGVMNVFGDTYGTNSLVEGPDRSQSAAKQEVLLTSIDDYCHTQNIDHIDLLKIDAEGYDFEIIAGAAQMFNRGAIDVLQFEYNQLWIGARNYLRDVFELLSPLGYSIGKVTREGVEFYPEWEWELESYRIGNYIACRDALKPNFNPVQPTWLTADR